jgi:hypothetical protein
LEQEKNEQKASNEEKPFRLATAVPVDIDIARQAKWTNDGTYAYTKFTIKLNGAFSSSINFDKFYMPESTEMYVYNENGEMITGPITENENNPNQIWGTWVYQGEYLSIEIKTPLATKDKLLLHTSNIAYGYKQIYKSIKVGGFGQSGSCNINVICPLGIGWEAERNSVATILSENGGEFCTGSLVMNTCNTTIPYFLTANHCFEASSNVNGWRFNFQAWSSTCPNPGINVVGITYNRATLRARNVPSDFCLVELNQTPPANSGLHYAGWTRSITPAQNATAIHHPSGDLMKISRANSAVTVASAFGTNNQHWRTNWSPQNNGAGQTVTPITEVGSSGSPLFDQNHRIIGQLHGGPSFCGATQLWDFYGRFDLSWTGGGTNATRLSNWLDPNNLGSMTTNTTNINNLLNVSDLTNQIIGSSLFCSVGTTSSYSIVVPNGLTVTWSATGSVNINANTGLATAIGNGIGTVIANISGAPCGNIQFTKTVWVGNPVITYLPPGNNPCANNPYYLMPNILGLTYQWSVDNQSIWFPGGNTSQSTSVLSRDPYYFTITLTISSGGCSTTQTLNTYTDGYYCQCFSDPSCPGQGGFGMMVYPNPSNEELTIEATDEGSDKNLQNKSSEGEGESTHIDKQLELLNPYQQTVWTGKLKNGKAKINTRDLAEGTYFLKITDDKETVVKRIIIKH